MSFVARIHQCFKANVVRHIVTFVDFLEDNLSFTFNVGRVKLGVEIHISQHLKTLLHVGVKRSRVETSVALCGVGVDECANAVRFVGNVKGTSCGCALENHVLDEVGDACFTRGFIFSACVDKYAD